MVNTFVKCTEMVGERTFIFRRIIYSIIWCSQLTGACLYWFHKSFFWGESGCEATPLLHVLYSSSMMSVPEGVACPHLSQPSNKGFVQQPPGAEMTSSQQTWQLTCSHHLCALAARFSKTLLHSSVFYTSTYIRNSIKKKPTIFIFMRTLLKTC